MSIMLSFVGILITRKEKKKNIPTTVCKFNTDNEVIKPS